MRLKKLRGEKVREYRRKEGKKREGAGKAFPIALRQSTVPLLDLSDKPWLFQALQPQEHSRGVHTRV